MKEREIVTEGGLTSSQWFSERALFYSRG